MALEIVYDHRVLVCGGRVFGNKEAVSAALDVLHACRRITLIIHGAARGADELAGEWAVENEVPVLAEPADWATDGDRAGLIRNEAMLRHQPHLVLAFPGGTGTDDMVRRAEVAGVPTLRVGWTPYRGGSRRGATNRRR